MKISQAQFQCIKQAFSKLITVFEEKTISKLSYFRGASPVTATW